MYSESSVIIVCVLCCVLRLDFRPDQGRYDLLISNASYERDNGQFECRLKAAGSGKDLHSQSFTVTVLTPPGPPTISPSLTPTATEGKPLELACSSSGGSPDPVIRYALGSLNMNRFFFEICFSARVFNGLPCFVKRQVFIRWYQ